MKRALWAAVIAALLLAAWLLLRPGEGGGPDISARAKQVPPPAALTLSSQFISADDLPPDGTRSLFDHLVAQNQSLPYPFPKLVEMVRRSDPQNAPPLTLLIPQGRSLLKASADDAHPRVLAAADFQAADTPAGLGLAPRGQLFLGFVEQAHEIEVLSYNEAAGRYEFQLVQNYCDGCVPRIVYARRAICTTCHQSAVPIFPQRPWNETNGQTVTAEHIAAARGNEPYLGVPVQNALGVPERFDELTDVGMFNVVTQRTWIDGCAQSADCRRQQLKVALEYLWSPAQFDEHGANAQRLRDLQKASWPATGIVVPNNDLPNRDPVAETQGIKGFFRSLFTRHPEPGAGAKDNEDLAAFDRLPKLPASLDPLTPRAPKRTLTADDLDGAYGIAALFTESDFARLEAASGHDLAKLLGAVDGLDAGVLKAQVYARVRMMNALLAALRAPAPLDYCCWSTAEMSPPVASGEPPVKIADGSVLLEFQRYCFACHRGNPSAKLNFMAGRSEVEVLEHIKAKSEIRDALDWQRYKGTDKENKLMPPADSAQRAALAADAQKDPKLLGRMRDTVPGLFDF
ncbi:MAG TPA: hypothetical protein VHE37_05880 [Nevskiaceae bacterium]|nr:hypothetical protein [Nevskiaceae bacterium]